MKHVLTVLVALAVLATPAAPSAATTAPPTAAAVSTEVSASGSAAEAPSSAVPPAAVPPGALTVGAPPATPAPASPGTTAAPPGTPPTYHPARAEAAYPTRPAPAADPSAVPDFGPADKVVAAWQAKRISDDDLVRYGVLRLTNSPELPADLRSTTDLGHRIGAYKAFLFSRLSSATPRTQAWVRDLFTTKGGPPDQPPAGTAAPTAAPAAPAAGAERPDDPRNVCSTIPWVYVLETFECLYTGDRFQIYYNIAEATGAKGLPPVFTRSTDTPDTVYQMVQGMESGFRTYDALGMGLLQPEGRLKMYVGHAFARGGGSTTPGDSPDPYENPMIFLPDSLENTGPDAEIAASRYNYLPRHELFHAYQYTTIDFLRAVPPSEETNWWMEATAEWATHKSFEADGTAWNGVPGEDVYYTRSLDRFLGQPHRALTAWDGWGALRQYSLFPLVQYLTERTDSRFVARTWGNYPDTADHIVDAVKRTLAGYGLDLSAVLLDFAIANYRIDAPKTVYSPQTGGQVTVPGYTDPDVTDGTWRKALTNAKTFPAEVIHDQYAGARPKRDRILMGGADGLPDTGPRTTLLQPGGTHYVDLVDNLGATPSDNPSVLRIQVRPGENLRYAVLTWRRGGQGAPAVARLDTFDATGSATVRLDDPDFVSTLVITRAELDGPPADAVEDVLAVTWEASLGLERPSNVTPDSAPVRVIAPRPGLPARYTFTGANEEYLYLSAKVNGPADYILRGWNGAEIARTEIRDSNADVHPLFIGPGPHGLFVYKGPGSLVFTVDVIPRSERPLDVTLRVFRYGAHSYTTTAADGPTGSVGTTVWGQRAWVRVPVTYGREFSTVFTHPNRAAVIATGSGGPDQLREYPPGAEQTVTEPRPAESTGEHWLHIIPLGNSGTDTPVTYQARAFGTVSTTATTADGRPNRITLPDSGRRTRLTFAGKPGQTLYASALDAAATGCAEATACRITGTLKAPNGDIVARGEFPVGATPPQPLTAFDRTPLTQDGPYTLELENRRMASATFTVAVFSTTAVPSGISMSGTPVGPITMPQGKQGTYAFTAAQGATHTITATVYQAPPPGSELPRYSPQPIACTGTIGYSVRDPFDREIASGTLSCGTGTPQTIAAALTIPLPGTYTVWLRAPGAGATVTVTAPKI
ncbi:hypothetical protein [Yinghuangia soli]|uniref:Uncharacterized protein n=1 Tax=Yinghuangia soli TaxID=2908204 RepID=A0AA41Q3R0_9ACTN|nr:hypothetical protein [Yinghuangia soli]MCF2530771.1 hypothetical protein [Yinghuangia soli]